MKPILTTCICMLGVAVVWGDGGSTPTSIPLTENHWLSFLGSRAKVEAYMNDHASQFSLRLETSNGTFSMENYSYNKANGGLGAQLAEKLTLQMRASLTSADNGREVTSWIGMFYDIRRSNGGWMTAGIFCSKPPFIVTSDLQGNVVVPTNDVLSWPLNQFLVITNAPKGIQQIEYLWKYPDGTIALQEMVPSGKNGWPHEDGVLCLSVSATDGEQIQLYGYTGKLILHYSDRTETYNFITGEQEDSSLLRLRMDTIGTLPLVHIIGWPGKEVYLESRDGLSTQTWKTRGSVILDAEGNGMFIFPQTTPSLFVRGRTANTQ